MRGMKHTAAFDLCTISLCTHKLRDLEIASAVLGLIAFMLCSVEREHSMLWLHDREILSENFFPRCRPFVHPSHILRNAGGRLRISRETLCINQEMVVSNAESQRSMNGISLEALTKAVVHRQGGGRFLSQRVTSYPQFAILMGDSSWRLVYCGDSGNQTALNWVFPRFGGGPEATRRRENQGTNYVVHIQLLIFFSLSFPLFSPFSPLPSNL
ncbi:Uncharacterized protein HZ326_1563 [Fusarium oxysporum f. sp. albedinis]|nr:Uncharacterized protein HZ326_1563 [Fusarium oxysporum f. sp. albedinis]